jgi:hypothetical protein
MGRLPDHDVSGGTWHRAGGPRLASLDAAQWRGLDNIGLDGPRWAGVIGDVAGALDDARLPDAAGALAPGQSLLAAITDATPPGLRRALALRRAREQAGDASVEPLLFDNELPPYLLAHDIIGVASGAVAESLNGLRSPRAPRPTGIPIAAGDDTPERVLAATALSALSVLRLEHVGAGQTLAHVRDQVERFSTPEWALALGSLAQRTAELYRQLLSARADRRQGWRGVSTADRVLAEAVAAAVTGGAADLSGVEPQRWRFPFHVLCRLGATAAEDALGAIERWLAVEFLPAPRTPERLASLGTLVAQQASRLHDGCPCKEEIDPHEVAFTPRGRCRQDDHDLRLWQPGQVRPHSSGGGQFAITLWGWLRRWLGGAGPREDANPGGRPRLRTNDVAGSVLTRNWLSVDRGYGGPVLRYDRILPEFCMTCEKEVQFGGATAGTGHIQIRRCCGNNDHRRVYRSDFAVRGGKRVLNPKLGLVVASQTGPEFIPHAATSVDEKAFRAIGGSPAGYTPTTSLGTLWVCAGCGRYSLSEGYCPSPGCSPARKHGQSRVPYGWVLLPLEEAWDDLKATAGKAGPELVLGPISGADLAYLLRILSQILPGERPPLDTPHDIWQYARTWPAAVIDQFRALGGERGLELLWRCKMQAETP